MAKEEIKPVAQPGDMVIAKIGGKETGPLYFEQLVDGKAELQGVSRHTVELSEIVRKA